MSFDTAFAKTKRSTHSFLHTFFIFSVSYVFYSFIFFFVSPIYTRIESGAISPPPPPPIKGVPLNNNKNEQQDLGEFCTLSFRLQERPREVHYRNRSFPMRFPKNQKKLKINHLGVIRLNHLVSNERKVEEKQNVWVHFWLIPCFIYFLFMWRGQLPIAHFSQNNDIKSSVVGFWVVIEFSLARGVIAVSFGAAIFSAATLIVSFGLFWLFGARFLRASTTQRARCAISQRLLFIS